MPTQPRLLDSILADERALLSASLWSGSMLLDGVVWSRHLAGAMTVPLSTAVVWGSSLVVSAMALYALVCWRETKAALFPHREWWPELLTLTLPLMWGLALGPQSSPLTWGGLSALWGMMIVAVGLVELWFPRLDAARTDDELAGEVTAAGEASTTADGSRNADQAHATQFQRRLIVDGVEVIEGEATADFLPGQKEAILHLSFCPPFSAVPDVQAEDALGGDLEIRAEVVHPFGARLSVRRASGIEAAESRQVSYLASPTATGEVAA